MSLARRWIAAPELQRTYLALLRPGGAAVEHQTAACAGTSHLLEHLFYRQNELDGHPLDHLGASMELLTTAETQHVLAAVAPEDAPRFAACFERWASAPRFPPAIVDSEIEVVIDEVEQAGRSPARTLWHQLMIRLAPASHLAGDFGGDAASLRALSGAQIADAQQRITSIGGALVALGPTSPWPAAAPLAHPAWTPPRVPIGGARQYEEIPIWGVGHSIVGCARLFAGLSSEDVIGAYARYASLAFGRVHEAQRRFHCELNLRYLQVELRVYRDAAVLAAFARCPTALAETVAALVEQLLCVPGEASAPERLRRCVLHYLLATRDDPERRALDEAARALYGVEPLDAVIARARAMSPAQLAAVTERAARSAATTVVFVEERA
jgi:hypothetical protein